MDEYLTQLYYNPKRSGSLGGVERLYRDVKKEGKYDISRAQLKKWLMRQDTYTLHKQARRHYKRKSRYCWWYRRIMADGFSRHASPC